MKHRTSRNTAQGSTKASLAQRNARPPQQHTNSRAGNAAKNTRRPTRGEAAERAAQHEHDVLADLRRVARVRVNVVACSSLFAAERESSNDQVVGENDAIMREGRGWQSSGAHTKNVARSRIQEPQHSYASERKLCEIPARPSAQQNSCTSLIERRSDQRPSSGADTSCPTKNLHGESDQDWHGCSPQRAR